jgi:uncharacterized protein (TIGR02687 family)
MSSYQHLDSLFKRHRIVLWYDPNQEFTDDAISYPDPDVTVLTVNNTQFRSKYRILVQEPQQKFLLYFPYAEPASIDNWLLDIQHAYATYRNDKVSIWLDELEWPATLRPVVQAHSAFFANKDRRRALATLVTTPTEEMIRRGIIAAVCGGRIDVTDTTVRILNNAVTQTDQPTESEVSGLFISTIRTYGVIEQFWADIGQTYGYRASNPTLLDFVLAVFGHAYAESLRDQSTSTPYATQYTLNIHAIALLRSWQDSSTYAASYAEYARTVVRKNTSLRLHLETQNIETINQIDWFVECDRTLIDKIAAAIQDRSLATADIDRIIRTRYQGFWVRNDPTLKAMYSLLLHAAHLLQAVATEQYSMANPADAVSRYTSSWYKVDQQYRLFVAARSACIDSTSDALVPLSERVERTYVNTYLTTLNTKWQDLINPMTTWPWPDAIAQAGFFERVVKPIIAQKKLCVIVADGLRYEMAEELHRMLGQTSHTTLSAMISVLPSYTQLGQAALLPHTTLEIRSDTDNTVLVDGRASAGIVNRTQILQTTSGVISTAFTHEVFTAKNSDERRAIIRDHQLVYIYHNSIDSTGESQEQTLCAQSDRFLNELVRLVTSLQNSHASNIVITADHGFLYQHVAPEEGEFMQYSGNTEAVVSQNRRMVIGTNLTVQPSLKKWHAADIGLAGTTEIQIPYSIVRLRRQGAQKHYSHGGASLQEIVVPVITIQRLQTTSVQKVPYKVAAGSTTITTVQAVVRFYQEQPVSDGFVGREIRAVFVAADGTEITTRNILTFDSPSAEPRARETTVQFPLNTTAKRYNRQDVFLSIAEKVAGSELWNEIERLPYKLSQSVLYDDDDE